MSTLRDAQLGEALRALDVPAHGPEFWTDLAAALRAERAGAAPASAVTQEEAAPVELRDHQAEHAAPRRPAAPPAPTRHHRRWLASAAVAALVAAVVAAAALMSDGPQRTTTVPPAGETPTTAPPTSVVATVPESLAAEVTVTLADGTVHELQVVAARDGSRSVTDLDTGERTVRDAVEGVVLGAPPTDGSGGPNAFRTRGVPPGGPASMLADAVTDPDIVDHVLALVDAGDPAVTSTEVLGRPAWRLVTAVTPNKLSGVALDSAVVVVDKATALLVLLEETAGGELFRRIEVTSLQASDEVLDRSTFQPDDDAEPFDAGFERVALEDVPALVGDAGLVPGEVPAGFELAAVAVQPGAGAFTGAEGLGPISIDTVVLTYRRGWEQLVVTSRRTGDDPQAWGDPFRGEGQVLETSDATITGGALGGTAVEVLLDPTTTPHLWGVHPEVVVTVSGPLSGDRLLEVAGSLERTG